MHGYACAVSMNGRMLSFQPGDEALVSPSISLSQPSPFCELEQCEQYEPVCTPRTGTGAISNPHNGTAQVAQVVVCHVLQSNGRQAHRDGERHSLEVMLIRCRAKILL